MRKADTSRDNMIKEGRDVLGKGKGARQNKEQISARAVFVMFSFWLILYSVALLLPRIWPSEHTTFTN